MAIRKIKYLPTQGYRLLLAKVLLFGTVHHDFLGMPEADHEKQTSTDRQRTLAKRQISDPSVPYHLEVGQEGQMHLVGDA